MGALFVIVEALAFVVEEDLLNDLFDFVHFIPFFKFTYIISNQIRIVKKFFNFFKPLPKINGLTAIQTYKL